MLKNLALAVAAMIGSMQLAPTAMAQDFPNKQPLRIVVPVPAGGLADVKARITAEFLRQRLGQTVIVDNKPGASSTIGIGYVAKAPADGYTLLYVGPEFAVVPAVRKNLPYNYDDFTYLVRPFTRSAVVVASSKYPGTNLQSLIADMKARPGQVSYGSTGIGAIVHMGVVTFESAVGVKGLHVPYAGMAPLMNDLMGGTVDFTMMTPPFAEGYKVLGAASSKRNSFFPDVPTLEEQGIKGANWGSWWGFMVPAKTPKPVSDRLTAELTAVFKDPAARAKFVEVGNFVPEDPMLTGEAFKRQVLEDHKRWKAVADRDKIQLD